MKTFSDVQKLNAMTGIDLESCEMALNMSNGNINDAIRLLRMRTDDSSLYVDIQKRIIP